MIKTPLFFLFCSLIIGACSTSEEPRSDDAHLVNEVKISSNPICLNHLVLVLDSITYYGAVNSEFVQRFAFSQERQLDGYKGFYLFGKTNYVEFFHPKSFDGYEEEEGGMWVNLALLKANYIKNLNWEHLGFIEYESNDHFYDLSLIVGDSINPIATWEMTKEHYESWTKKEYNDSMDFLPIDYNSPQDADSSSHYLMSDVIGFGLSLNPEDSLATVRYLNTVGFEAVSKHSGLTRISNNDQFVELHISSANNSPSINRIYIQLNKAVEQKTEVIGNSRVECGGKSATWYFE